MFLRPGKCLSSVVIGEIGGFEKKKDGKEYRNETRNKTIIRSMIRIIIGGKTLKVKRRIRRMRRRRKRG